MASPKVVTQLPTGKRSLNPDESAEQIAQLLEAAAKLSRVQRPTKSMRNTIEKLAKDTRMDEGDVKYRLDHLLRTAAILFEVEAYERCDAYGQWKEYFRTL